MVGIDAANKVASFADGSQIKYNKVTTLKFKKKMKYIEINKLFLKNKRFFFFPFSFVQLLSTIPLDITLTWLGREELAKKLVHSSSHIVGLGLRGTNPHGAKCWMYYPEDDCPYYRCTVFSHYGVGNVPVASKSLPTLRLGDPSLPVADASSREGPYWSLMFEISESTPWKPVNLETIVEVRICIDMYYR